MILGIDATNPTTQYGFIDDIKSQCFQIMNHHHLEELPNLISKLINDYDGPIEGLVTIIGPGSYTGIRLSLTVVKMISKVYKVPMIGVSLFEAYMNINASLLNELVILTSNSRKGYVNLQIFQCRSHGATSISSLLQVSYSQLNSFLTKFSVPVNWHHIGAPFLGESEKLVNKSKLHQFKGHSFLNAQLSIQSLLMYYQSNRKLFNLNTNQPVKPLYSSSV